MFNILTQATDTNLLNQILIPVLAALGTALATILTFGATRLIAWINAKIGNDKLAGAINKAGDIILAAVETTNQNFVDQLKKDGKFDREAQEQAFKNTLDLVYKLLSEEAKELIEDAFGDLETYLRVIIEKVIAGLK